jgi:hypothetical protein
MAEIKGRALKGDQMNKTIVMGMLDRDVREVRAKIIPNVRRDTLQREILRGVCRRFEGLHRRVDWLQRPERELRA